MAGFDADTRLHIHKEEDVLVPAVLARVTEGAAAGSHDRTAVLALVHQIGLSALFAGVRSDET